MTCDDGRSDTSSASGWAAAAGAASVTAVRAVTTPSSEGAARCCRPAEVAFWS